MQKHDISKNRLQSYLIIGIVT